MKTPTRLVVLTIECLALSLCFGIASALAGTHVEAGTQVEAGTRPEPLCGPSPEPATRAYAQPGGAWLVDRSDNICGLDDPKMLSRPARVDYGDLLRNTPEMKKMRDDSIDPDSSEGIQLRQAAVDRVRRACERVRAAAGHCSVWKEIRHSEGKSAPDITELVRKEL